MARPRPPPPVSGDWADALLSSGTESLIAAVRNYLGPVKTPYDKRDLARRLEAFLRRPETQDSIIALLDGLDARVLGSLLLLGPLLEPDLRELFSGEVPLFELGLRIANLYDRLLLFRYGTARLVAVNPILAQRIGAAVLSARVLFGPAETPNLSIREGSRAPSRSTPRSPLRTTCNAETATAFFSFLFHSPLSLRKSGSLTKRAGERAEVLFPAYGAAALDALARSLSAAGVLPVEDEARAPDPSAFSALLARWGGDLPFLLAAALATEAGFAAGARENARESPRDETEAGLSHQEIEARSSPLASIIAHCAKSSPPGLVFSRPGILRALRIAARRAGMGTDPAPAVDAMENLGLLEPDGDGLRFASPTTRDADAADDAQGNASGSATGAARPAAALGAAALGAAAPGAAAPGVAEGAAPGAAGGAAPGGAAPGAAAPGAPGLRRGVLVAEGAHAFHLLPEATLAERFLVGCVAKPVSIGKVWSFEIERDTARRAFASGRDAAGIISSLEAMASLALPQSLVFSLKAWEEEYRALRIYRGLVLVADERLRAVIERSRALSGLVAEQLAPGAYFLASGSAEEVAAALGRAGLEMPPETIPAGRPAGVGEGSPGQIEGSGTESYPLFPGPRQTAAEVFDLSAELVGDESAAFDPEPRMADLRAALSSSVRAPEECRELAERIDRRLVVGERQIADGEMRGERLEAGGLDYLGKVRVVERALRSPGDRLEVLYRLPGADPVRALLRPVRLGKNEKGLVLEAEDLATGGPARVPLGAVSTVRRVRASLFGEDA